MLEELKQIVYKANMELPRRGLITYTWGSTSGIDRERRLSVIRPSGVDYDKLKPSQIVVVDLEGNKVEGDMSPSSDTATHVELYKVFKDIGGIVHAYSPHAAVQAQAGRALSRHGVTHADYFYKEIPCVRNLTGEEIEEGCEMNTDKVIMETFASENPVYVPTVLCKNHGPFTWGKDAAEAMHNAVVLEGMAKMSCMTETLSPQMEPASQHILDKHFTRKHGSDACYGQKNRQGRF